MTVSLDTYPKTGQLMPDYIFTTLAGRRVPLSSHDRRYSLVMVFADGASCAPCTSLLAGLARRYEEFKSVHGEVLAVVHRSLEEASALTLSERLPFQVVVDADGEVHRTVGAVAADGGVPLVVYVTDRYGYIYQVFRVAEGEDAPTPDEILDWLQYIDIECPE